MDKNVIHFRVTWRRSSPRIKTVVVTTSVPGGVVTAMGHGSHAQEAIADAEAKLSLVHGRKLGIASLMLRAPKEQV